MKPNYTHDCDQCFFLGRMQEKVTIYPNFAVVEEDWSLVFSEDVEENIDLYFCTKQPTGPTVIARYSSDGSDYASGLAHAAANKHLQAAKTLAVAKGLLP